MKSLTKMFLLACWSLCFVSMSFAAGTDAEKLRLENEWLQQQQTEESSIEAKNEAKKIGCIGVHKMGKLWMPCAPHINPD